MVQDVGLDDLPAPGETFSRLFDRSWAKATVREAAALQVARQPNWEVTRHGDPSLLRLRFFDGLADPRDRAAMEASIRRSFITSMQSARAEFRKALGDVVAFDHPGTPEEIEARCHDLLSLLNRA